MLLGDFNNILILSKVRGGAFYSSRAIQFGDMIDNCKLLDLGFIGPTFTWHRSLHGYHRISKRLDRVLVDGEWRTTFLEASCLNLHRLY